MTTLVEHADKKPPAVPPALPGARADMIVTPPPAPPAPAAPTASAAAATAHPTDGMDFVGHNRIHVEHGSLFIDPYTVIHPRDLAPAREAVLRERLALAESLNNPSFFEAPERNAITVNLGKLVPVSFMSARSKLLDAVDKFNREVDAGVDAQLQQQADDKHHPFAAVVRDAVENPQTDPVGLEVLKNGLSIYLLLREKLTRNRYLKPLAEYVTRSNTPDQVLHDLADNIGVTPLQVREAALHGGIDGVGQLLGLEPATIADIRAAADYAASRDFGYNSIEHWHRGRQKLGTDASMAQKIATGMEDRIDQRIRTARADMHGYYDVPEPIKAEEQRIVREDMSVLEPIQKKLLFALNYQICHTPENTADSIAFHKNIYGLHRKAANDLTDINGTYFIYYAGHGSRKGAVGTLAHEVAHNFWPNYFTPEETARVDQLVGDDAKRFNRLQRLMDVDFDAFEKFHASYQVGSAEEKKAIIASANERFAEYGITVDGLFPSLRDAKSFRLLVWDANDVLAVEGARYNRSGYNTTQERFREVISRYAEMRQVSHRDEPDVLAFVAPGLKEMWEKYYIPHLERVYADVVKNPPRAPNSFAPMPGNAATYHDATHTPKVDERTQPTHSTPDAHDKALAPENTVFSPSMQFDPRNVAAMSALRSMRNFVG